MSNSTSQAIWYPNPGPQMNAFLCEAEEVMFGGGRGCVHPDTLLDTPMGQIKIKDFQGGPIYSYKEGDVIVTYATPSVEGTKEDLYEVTLSNGLSVTCTDEHKFLTPEGWKMLSELGVSQRIVSHQDVKRLSAFFSPPQTNSDNVPSESQLNAQRSRRTLEGSQVSYSGYCRQCDRQLQWEEGIGPVYFPPQGDDQPHSFHVLYREDAQVICGRDSLSSSLCHASSLGAPPFEEERSYEGQENYNDDKSSELPSGTFLSRLLSPECRAHNWPIRRHGVLQRGFYFWKRQARNLQKALGKLATSCLYNPSISPKVGVDANDYITSIRKVNPLKYWDLHVPETNCYFAQGILHHNSGKSALLFGKVLQHVEKNRGKAKMIFFRENFDDLGDLIDKGKDILVANGLADYIAGQTKEFRFKGAFEGAKLKMRQIEHIDDLKKYKGHEYTYIGFDEICDFKLPFELINDTFMATLRNPHGIKGQIVYTGNPGGYNHTAVKRYFIDPWPSGNRIIENEFGQQRCFFQSTVDDNPHLISDPTYMRQLERIKDPAMRRAWRYGDWSVALGAMFSDVWYPSKHVLNYSITPQDIPDHFESYRGLDWGSSTPFAYLRCFVSTGEDLLNGKGNFPAGAVVFYNEYYGWQPGNKVNEGVKMSSGEVAREIRKREEADGDYWKLNGGIADNQIFQVSDGTPIYAAFYKEGIKFSESNKAAGTRAAGCEIIRNKLVGYDDKPQLYFTKDCVHTIRTLPTLSRDKMNPEVLANYQENHCFDVCKYLLLSMNALHTPATAAATRKEMTSREKFLQEMMDDDY